MDLINRLENITKKDKSNNPKLLSELIKSDFFYLISNYFEVNFDDISVQITCDESKYSIDINCLGDRMKLLRSIPD